MGGPKGRDTAVIGDVSFNDCEVCKLFDSDIDPTGAPFTPRTPKKKAKKAPKNSKKGKEGKEAHGKGKLSASLQTKKTTSPSMMGLLILTVSAVVAVITASAPPRNSTQAEPYTYDANEALYMTVDNSDELGGAQMKAKLNKIMAAGARIGLLSEDGTMAASVSDESQKLWRDIDSYVA